MWITYTKFHGWCAHVRSQPRRRGTLLHIWFNVTSKFITLFSCSEPFRSKIHHSESRRLVHLVESTTDKYPGCMILAPYMSNSWPRPTCSSLDWILLCWCVCAKVPRVVFVTCHVASSVFSSSHLVVTRRLM